MAAPPAAAAAAAATAAVQAAALLVDAGRRGASGDLSGDLDVARVSIVIGVLQDALLSGAGLADLRVRPGWRLSACAVVAEV